MDAGEAAAAVQVQHSPNGYVEYRPGTGGWPVVLAAPHGGALMPTAVPDRTDGVAEPDWKSLELAVAVLEAFQAAGGESAGAPALVTLMLDRRKMDGNRARGPCCEPLRLTNITGLGPDRHKGNCVEQLEAEGAPGAWDAYHGWLAEALMKAVESHGFCLLLDLHGQSHRKGATELGYLLTSEDFLLSDEAIDAAQPRPSSVDALLRVAEPRGGSAARTTSSLAGLVRGPTSLGAFLEAKGFACVPSPSKPQPVDEAALRAAQRSDADITAAKGPPPEAAAAATYFWGAYSVRRYGAAGTVPSDMDPLTPEEQSAWGNKVAAVQLETSWDGVRDSEESRVAFGQGLCEATQELLRAWTGWNVGNSGGLTPTPAAGVGGSGLL